MLVYEAGKMKIDVIKIEDNDNETKGIWIVKKHRKVFEPIRREKVIIMNVLRENSIEGEIEIHSDENQNLGKPILKFKSKNAVPKKIINYQTDTVEIDAPLDKDNNVTDWNDAYSKAVEKFNKSNSNKITGDQNA